jgi:hypothetical protein
MSIMITRHRQRLCDLGFGLRGVPSECLRAMVLERRHPLLLRAAALRWLVHLAPLSVTQGAPFAERRRLARIHYRV